MQPTKEKPPKTLTQKPKPQPLPETSEGLESPVTVNRHTDYSSLCKWEIPNFPKIKAKSLYSPYFEVGGFDFRFLIYPKGDSLALPGYISLYIQINDPRGSNFDCYATYKLTIVNLLNDKKSSYKESSYRFSKIRKSIGWSEFTVAKKVLAPASGFLKNACLVVSVDVNVLNETKSFSMDRNDTKSHVLAGRVTWTIRNFGLFKEAIKTQKIISSVFPVGESNCRINLYRSVVNGVEYLSLFLELKETDKHSIVFHRSCWCMFRISLSNQKPGLNHMHRDSHGRLGVNSIFGEDTSLGWTEYMKMSAFVGEGFLVDDTAMISVSFNAIKESSISLKTGNLFGGKSKSARGVVKKNDGCTGKFLWKIYNFSRLKDILKRKKITGLCVKSRTFQIGNLDFRLLVYPRGQSQKPFHISLFLEVMDPVHTSSDWSSFVMYQLAVMNQKIIDKSVTRESQDRCSKATRECGWSDFMTLTSFFDQESGYLDQDTAVFSAEIRILKETFIFKSITESINKAEMDDKSWLVNWKVENFLSLKDVMATQKIFSKFFQVGGCKLRIGFYESSDNVCAYLEGDPSIVSDPDKNFWISYRLGVVNQKEPAQSLWKESSICTKSCTNSDLQLMEVSDMLEADAGFVVHEMVIFACEILDWCPWFDFSEAELLAKDIDQDDPSSELYELDDPKNSEVITGSIANVFKMLIVRAGCFLMDEYNSRQLVVNLKELLTGTGAVAQLLVGMCIYFDATVKAKYLVFETKCSGSNGWNKDTVANESSTKLTNTMIGLEVLQQTINNALLEIMVECCQPSNNSAEESFAASLKHSAYANATFCQSEYQWEIRPMVSIESSLCEGSKNGFNVSAGSCAGQLKGNDLFKNIIYEQCSPLLETYTSDPVESSYFQAFKDEWPEPSEELLGLILNSLKTLNGPVSQIHPEPRQRSQSAEKVFLLLEKAPKHLQPDLISLLPKLVNLSEHPPAACALLDQLTKPEAEPAARPPVLATISQLDLDNEGWEETFYRASQLLEESNGEVLGAIIVFLFGAASRCQHIPQAVSVIHSRLKSLGAEISPHVLDLLSRTMNSQHDIAELMLREIDSVFTLDENCLTNPIGPFSNGGKAMNSLHLVDEQLMHAHLHFSDIFLLINMLAIPSLAREASQAFERGVAHGFIENHSVSMVLEKHAQRISINLVSSTENYEYQVTERQKNAESFSLEGVFTLVLSLARSLSLSTSSRVHGFLKMFYAMLFRLFADDSHHKSMLKGLVDLATSPADICSKTNLDILVFLIQEEQEFAKSVLSMMKDATEHASDDHSISQHQLCTTEEKLVNTEEEKQNALPHMCTEKNVLLERLTESEAAILHYKSEMHLEMERFACEKKELCGHIQAVESELEQFRSKKNEEVMKLSMEKKGYQDRLHHVETQLSQLKSQKSHELKKVKKENEVFAERLKNAKAVREKIDGELKRCASEVVAQEEARKKLMNEIRQLKQKIQQLEAVKQEKSKEVAHCRTYIDHMEAKLTACQEYIQSLENALKEEMLQHAPLYGVGLEDLSMKELETLSRIHEDGLKEIRNLQQRSSNLCGNPGRSLQNLPPTAQPSVTDEVSNLNFSNGVERHNNGHNSATATHWFSRTHFG